MVHLITEEAAVSKYVARRPRKQIETYEPAKIEAPNLDPTAAILDNAYGLEIVTKHFIDL
jgi:hypothetical protein